MLGLLSNTFKIATRQDSWNPPAAMRTHSGECRRHEDRKQRELRKQRAHNLRRMNW